MNNTYDESFNNLKRVKKEIETQYARKANGLMQKACLSAMSGLSIAGAAFSLQFEYSINNEFVIRAVNKGLSSSFVQENISNIANMNGEAVLFGAAMTALGVGAVASGAQVIASKRADKIAKNIHTDQELQEKHIFKTMENINGNFVKKKEKSILQKAIKKVKTLFLTNDDNKVKIENKKDNEIKNNDSFSNIFEKSLKDIDLEKNQVVKRDNKNTNKYKL